MPNGGHISCVYCSYGRRKDGRCDVFGTPISPYLLCRSFRGAKQSHREAHKEWDVLRDLEPGFVYKIDNSSIEIGNPRKAFKVVEFTL